mmetsp:Transcript_98277/g.135192  ORF Transcript_98277/g.135192 Transcript_98277/m.135192 type:complete len:89 (+) Transcript_98277:82-348(+)
MPISTCTSQSVGLTSLAKTDASRRAASISTRTSTARWKAKKSPRLSKKKPEVEMPVGPVMLGLFLFLVIGSSFVQLLQTTQQGSGFVE